MSGLRMTVTRTLWSRLHQFHTDPMMSGLRMMLSRALWSHLHQFLFDPAGQVIPAEWPQDDLDQGLVVTGHGALNLKVCIPVKTSTLS